MKKSKTALAASIVQFVVGICAIMAIILLIGEGERLSRWVITVILAVAYVVMGIIGIVDFMKNAK